MILIRENQLLNSLFLDLPTPVERLDGCLISVQQQFQHKVGYIVHFIINTFKKNILSHERNDNYINSCCTVLLTEH